MGIATRISSSYAQFDAVGRASGDIVRVYFRGVSSRDRCRAGHQSTIRIMPIGDGDTTCRPHVRQLVPMCDRVGDRLICGHVIGFRFHRGPADIIGFCLLVVVVGIVLSLLADLIGTKSRSPETTTPLLMLPQLIFGLLSVGIQPAERFPEWIQPVVRNQPISQFIYALRALAGETAHRRLADLVSNEPGPFLAARRACDPGAYVGRDHGKEAVMLLDQTAPPELARSASESSLRMLVPQTSYR